MAEVISINCAKINVTTLPLRYISGCPRGLQTSDTHFFIYFCSLRSQGQYQWGCLSVYVCLGVAVFGLNLFFLFVLHFHVFPFFWLRTASDSKYRHRVHGARSLSDTWKDQIVLVLHFFRFAFMLMAVRQGISVTYRNTRWSKRRKRKDNMGNAENPPDTKKKLGRQTKVLRGEDVSKSCTKMKTENHHGKGGTIIMYSKSCGYLVTFDNSGPDGNRWEKKISDPDFKFID